MASLAETFPKQTQTLTLLDMVRIVPAVTQFFTDADAQSALAVDMTARNLQEEVKKKGLPWSAVKGFDTFTPIRFACNLGTYRLLH